MCLLTITKPFASELETHTSKINVSPVSATLYTFMANTQAWYGLLQNVYRFHYTALHQKRARTLLTQFVTQIVTRILRRILLHILCLLLLCLSLNLYFT